MISQLSPVPALPKPFGPHKVGTTEWEIPVAEIPSSSPIPEPKITTIKFRLFYPTTPKAKSKTSVPWLPTPQREWNQAYASFLGASPRVSSLISLIPFLINMTNIPAVADAPLLPKNTSSNYPLVVFSHGLGGNFNAYSAVCAALASFGIVCAAPEHRDGSAPISPIRSADGRKTTSIPYQRHPHAPTTKVLNARNAQLRIRLWELEQLFTVLTNFNEGETFSNYAAARSKSKPGPLVPSLKDALDLRPGRVTWAGHSFGACTTVQFVKSVYYHEFLPSLKGTEFENDLDWRPLYKPADNSELVRQITPESPVILFDLWAMPLRAGLTKWLWEKPLPCYDRKTTDGDHHPPTNVVAIISSEFYKWPELLNRMKATLSARPAEAMYTLEKREAARSSKPQQKSESQLVATPGDKLPPDAEELEITSRRGFEANRDADLESDDGDELFVTPFATPGEEFSFDKIMTNRRSGFEAWREGGLGVQGIGKDVGEEINEESMREAVRLPLPDSEPEDEDEDEDVLGSVELDSHIDEEAEPEAEPDSEFASASRSSTSSNITTSSAASPSDSTSSLSTPASSIQLSRTSSPSPTCDSISSTTSTSNIDVNDATTFSVNEGDPEKFTLSFSPFSLLPLDLPKLSVVPNPNTPCPSDPHLYLIPNTAHLSQSDFGVLFPKLTRYLMNAESPVEAIRLNVRAMLAVMRNVGLEIEAYRDDDARGKKIAQVPLQQHFDEVGADDDDEDDEMDPILTERCKEERFVRVDIY